MLPNPLVSIEEALRQRGLPQRLFHMSKRPQIVGLAGKAGAGKDTVAALLRMRGYERRALADPIREEVSDAAAKREAPEGMNDRLAVLFRMGALCPKGIYGKPTPSHVRRILQWWGTEYRRAQDPYYWIQRVAETIYPDGYFSISDIRFANEAQFIRKMGGQVWLVKGRGGIDSDHISEKMDFEHDEEINNAGSIYELAESVSAALKRAIQ